MKTTLFSIRAARGLILLTALAQSTIHCQGATPAPSSPPSIDGTYELTERVMANGTVLRPSSIVALYTMADGRFSLNLFVKNADGTIASESSAGRYTFSAEKYCEWIVYTIRNNLDKPGVTNEAPAVTDHCAPVTAKDGRFNFSPPGEGVDVSFGVEGFTAKIGGDSSIIGKKSDRTGKPANDPGGWGFLLYVLQGCGRENALIYKPIMSNAAKRAILRWIHLILAIPIIGYVYSPFEELPNYAPVARFVSIPLLILSGFWMYAGVFFAIIGVTLWLGANYLFGYGAAILSQVALFVARKIWLVIRARRSK